MKKYFVLLTLFMICSGLYAQELPYFLKSDWKEYKGKFIADIVNAKKTNEMASVVNGKNYNVLSSKLYLNWTHPLSSERYDENSEPIIMPEDRIYTGNNTLTLLIEEDNANSVVLDIQYLEILGVKDGSGNNLNFTYNDQSCTINLLQAAGKDDTVIISVDYKYDGYGNIGGFYLYPKGLQERIWWWDDTTAPVEERLAYTMSEPQEARYWMPCNDSPDDKFLFEVFVEVPIGFDAVSNGLLLGTQETDTSLVFHWKSLYPITTYLTAITASRYTTFSHWYHKVTNPNDSVEIKYYVWDADYNGTLTDRTEFNAKHTFRYTVEMMEFYSRIFIEYPFEKYGMVSVFPFNFGGMEHQTMTSIHRSWMINDEQGGIAHELAHQWLGDLLTCSTWKDIWLNEGGATWSEALWWEHLYGKAVYNNSMYWNRFSYLRSGGLALPRIYNLNINDIFGSYAVLSYDKGGLVYSMLQSMVGDSLFFQTLRSMMHDYGYQSITTEMFRDYFKSKIPNPAVDFDTFFDQWIFSPGHPVYLLGTKFSFNESGTYNAEITIKQTQGDSIFQNVPDLFVVPLDIKFVNADSTQEYSVRIINNEQNQKAEFEIPFKPYGVIIDTVALLCELNENMITSVKDVNVSDEFFAQLFPNPVYGGNDYNIEINLPQPENVTINVYNNLGSRVNTIHDGYLTPGTYRLNAKSEGLPQGAYIIKIAYGNNIITKPLTVVR